MPLWIVPDPLNDSVQTTSYIAVGDISHQRMTTAFRPSLTDLLHGNLHPSAVDDSGHHWVNITIDGGLNQIALLVDIKLITLLLILVKSF